MEVNLETWLKFSPEEQTNLAIRGSGDSRGVYDIGINDITTELPSSSDCANQWSEFLATITLNGPLLCRFEADYNFWHRRTMIALIVKTLNRDSANAPWWHSARPGDIRRDISRTPDQMQMRTFTVAAERIVISAQAPTRIPHGEVSLRWVRAMAREAWLHELDEFLLIDGRRAYDPHRFDLVGQNADQLIVDDPQGPK